MKTGQSQGDVMANSKLSGMGTLAVEVWILTPDGYHHQGYSTRNLLMRDLVLPTVPSKAFMLESPLVASGELILIPLCRISIFFSRKRNTTWLL